MVNLNDLDAYRPNWCPGCGNFGIITALKMAIVEMNLNPEKVFVISGVGCSSKLPYFIKTYGFNSLHGRALPVAQGARFANTELNIVVITGDGDCYGEGGNHFMHAARRNMNITVIAHDNMVYGLTTGQTSPTSEKGYKSKSTPLGNNEISMNPIAVALANNGSFIARSFAGDIQHLKKMIIEGINHNGFSFIDVLQPCVTFNKINTFDFYKQRVYKLEESGHDFTNKIKAFEKSFEWGDKIPIGIFYKDERTCHESEFPQLKTPLYKHDIKNIDIDELMDGFC